MIKILLPLFCLGLFIEACAPMPESEEKIYSYLRSEGITGEVESIKFSFYACDSVGNPGELQINVWCTLDKNGNVVESSTYDGAGQKIGVEKTIFSPNGLPYSKTEYANGKKTRQVKFTLDELGNLDHSEIYDGQGKLLSFMDYPDPQNEYGQTTTLRVFNADSTLRFSEVARYDQYRLLGYTQKDSTGQEIFSYRCTYQNKGELATETSVEYREGKPTKTVKTHQITAYDPQGNWTSKIISEENGKKIQVKRAFKYRST